MQLQGHYQQAQAIVDQHYNNTYRQVEDIHIYEVDNIWQAMTILPTGRTFHVNDKDDNAALPQVDQQLESAQQLVAQRRSNSPQRPYPVRPKNRVRNHSLQGFVNLQQKY